MGSCESHPELGETLQEQLPARRQNPFFEPQPGEAEAEILSQYRFLSNYEDRFLGRCSVVQSVASRDLFLCKDIVFKSEEDCELVYRSLAEKKEQQAGCEELLRIKGSCRPMQRSSTGGWRASSATPRRSCCCWSTR